LLARTSCSAFYAPLFTVTNYDYNIIFIEKTDKTKIAYVIYFTEHMYTTF